MPETEWVTLHHPEQQAWHRVPNHPIVIQDFQDRGWETPEDSAARAEQDATQLHGQELEDALKAAGLPTSGKVKEKQERLAAHRAELSPSVEPTDPFDPLAATTPTVIEDTEGEQVND